MFHLFGMVHSALLEKVEPTVFCLSIIQFTFYRFFLPISIFILSLLQNTLLLHSHSFSTEKASGTYLSIQFHDFFIRHSETWQLVCSILNKICCWNLEQTPSLFISELFLNAYFQSSCMETSLSSKLTLALEFSQLWWNLIVPLSFHTIGQK